MKLTVKVLEVLVIAMIEKNKGGFYFGNDFDAKSIELAQMYDLKDLEKLPIDAVVKTYCEFLESYAETKMLVAKMYAKQADELKRQHKNEDARPATNRAINNADASTFITEVRASLLALLAQ